MTVVGRLPLRPRIDDLARHGDATAVVLDGRVLTHRELDDLVTQRAALLGPVRRLVMVECANELDPLVTYLAALRGGHPVLLMPGAETEPARRNAARVTASYRPDVVLRRGADGWALEEVRPGTVHDLHPDLAVLLGTSGSTGTPKLVRLSHDNLRANAEAIAGYLDLGPESRAATSLPLQYCYGLSVVNSHLLAGGSVWLTDLSVVDPGFWDGFRAAGATSLAGVPYTYELLERSGVDWLATPGLRQMTQAGGRMPADRVRRVAEAAAARGIDLFVMYGATEATARMAYLPPRLATARPECIGVPIDGGDFRIDAAAGSDQAGELVYSGPNVMMGYATAPADLARGPELTELRTGDLAVQHDDGLYEIVGRCNRIAKLFGTRLDLDLAERLLADQGVPARLVATPSTLRVFVEDGVLATRAGELVRAEHCLPAHAVAVQVVERFPTTATGKPDHGALAALPDETAPAEPTDVRSAYAGVFGRPVGDAESFVSLGGDSLSYVETYTRLERLLGVVPPDWPHRTVAELAEVRPAGRRGLARIEVPVVLRALAIFLVVGAHVDLWTVRGGAHTLLALTGYGLARFALSAPTRRQRVLGLLRSARELAVPAALWIGGVTLLTGAYLWTTPVLLNFAVRSERWTDDWQFWFLETAVWTAVGLAALTLVPAFDRTVQRHRMAAPMVVLALCLIPRAVLSEGDHFDPYRLGANLWCVALGWLIHAARSRGERLLVSLVVPATFWAYFPGETDRMYVVAGALLLLLWVPALVVPRPLDRVLGVVGSASLFIYLTHWQVYPDLEDAGHPYLALFASLVVGVVVWKVYSLARRTLPRVARQSLRRPRSGRALSRA